MARLGRGRIPSGKGMAGWLAGTAGLLAGQLPGGLGGARGDPQLETFQPQKKSEDFMKKLVLHCNLQCLGSFKNQND